MMAAANFLKELEQLANPAPLRDDEDHEDEATTARVVDKSLLQNDEIEGDDDDGKLSNRRIRRGVILAEEDERYNGAVVSRSMLDEDDDGIGESGDDNEEEASENGVEDGDEDEESREEEGDDDEEDEVEDEDEAEDDDDNVVLGQEDNDSTGLMKMFSNVDMRDENAKGRAVQAQIKLWEQLLGARIRFQRVLALVNQLPQTDEDWRNVQNDQSPTAESEQIGEQKLNGECRRILKSTLDEFIRIQDHLLKRNNVLEIGASTTNSKPGGDDDDDEILSSPDEDAEERQDGSREKPTAKKRKLNDLDDYSAFLEERHAAMKAFRDQTILKWFEKTRLATGRFNRASFNAFENNALQQIEHILADRDRLIKRTQLKRSTYSVLGKRRKTDEHGNEETDQEHDEEIFDDDDFYQQLLRELIERRTVGLTDPVALSRQWLELQKLRSKSKKKNVDRKASKGRRCRYDVIPKLVNFMAPVDHCPMADEAREELFKSLFKNAS